MYSSFSVNDDLNEGFRPRDSVLVQADEHGATDDGDTNNEQLEVESDRPASCCLVLRELDELHLDLLTLAAESFYHWLLSTSLASPICPRLSICLRRTSS